MIIPKYLNTSNSHDILSDTIEFLTQVIGCYIQVEIKSNIPNISFYLNKKMIQMQSLSDNARSYTQWSIPSQSREYGIWKLIEDICAERIITDRIFFIALGDFPIINKNRSIHPHSNRFTNNNYNGIYPNQMYPIYSRSIIPGIHDDLLFPTRDYIDMVYGIDKLIENSNNNFKSKKSIGIFRGSITGNDRTITNTRIQAKILSIKYPSYLDVELTKTFEYYMFEENSTLCICTEILNKQIYNPDSSKSLSGFDQNRNYKYLLHIDGFVSAWRMALELMSWSVILKVDSPWIEHYYTELIPWVHYIPVKSDLSDLIEIIDWCISNDDLCLQIASNAYNYGLNNFTKTKLFDYVEGKNVQDLTQNYFSPIVKPKSKSKPKPNPIANFDNPKYLRYLLPQLEPEPEPIYKVLEKGFIELGLIISDDICDQIYLNGINSNLYKHFNNNIVKVEGFFTDIGDNFDKLSKNIKISIDKYTEINENFSIIWNSDNLIFSPNTLCNKFDTISKLFQCVIVVFLSNDESEQLSYTIDNKEKTIIQAKKGKVVIFDPNIKLINSNQSKISLQMVYLVCLKIKKIDHLGILEKYIFEESPSYDEGINLLVKNTKYTNIYRPNKHTITFDSVEKKNNFGGVWYWEEQEIKLNSKDNLIQIKFYKEEQEIKLNSKENLIQIKFYKSDLISDYKIFYDEKNLNLECGIMIKDVYYKSTELFSPLIQYDYPYYLVINNDNFDKIIAIKSDTKLIFKYKSYLLKSTLRKFIAQI